MKGTGNCIGWLPQAPPDVEAWLRDNEYQFIVGAAMRAHLKKHLHNAKKAAQSFSRARSTFYRWWRRFKPGNSWSYL